MRSSTTRSSPVFSAHAEVVPLFTIMAFEKLGILRARGGSSGPLHIAGIVGVYSPRTRR